MLKREAMELICIRNNLAEIALVLRNEKLSKEVLEVVRHAVETSKRDIDKLIGWE